MPTPRRRLKAFILNLLFPLECLGCGGEGTWLCPACFRRLKFSPGKNTSRLKTAALDKIFIAGDYDDALLADLIKKFKYHFITALGKPLADFLILYWSGQMTLAALNNNQAASDNQALFNNRTAADFIVIPIPLSARRFRWRGFNQAEILAREFAASFSYPLSLGLIRQKHRGAQASLNESQRQKNISGVFAYAGPDLTDKNILLIDDVATTGATLNEAALILRAQGAEKIYGLVLAKG
jgi:ComF family protein